MSNTRIRIAVGLLLILNLALPVLLSPFGLTPGVDVTSSRVGYLTIGASLAQPALLAVWAALAPQPLLRRGMHALAMLVLSNLALNFTKVLNRGSRDEPADMLAIIVLLVAFAVCLLPLWLLRTRFRWRIAQPVAAHVACGRPDIQFSLRGMLLAMVFVATLFAALRWLHPGNLAISTLWMHVLRLAGFGLVMGLLSLPVLIVCWLVLWRGGRSRLRWFIGVIGGCAIAAAGIAAAMYGPPGDYNELVFVLQGMLLCAAPSFWIIRLCGYRLLRPARDGALAPELLPSDARSPSLRFAIAICSMILMLLAITSVLPSRLRVWREKAQQRRWSEVDFSASLADGQVISLTYLSDAVHPINAGVVGRISACSRLERLSLGPSNAGDGALAKLGELPELGRLSLFGTRVTDKGLRDLRKFPNLADLDLRATDIGDDGLLALAGLEHLRVVDVCLTRVTQRGIARLQRARPGLRISSTTDDATLAIVTSSFQPRGTVLSRPAGWRPIAVRLHAVGPAVTDVGVAALRGMTNIEELDLTDTSVSDAAVGDLATLSRLKKLVLGGTQVSESGIARLRQALPGCTIEP